MRIVQVANFVTPSSGGLRTTLRHLAEGYARRGHDVVQLLPGPYDAVVGTEWGRQVFLRAPAVPGTGYRVVLAPRRVKRALDHLAPDRLEVHDRTTLRGLGGWARSRGVPSLTVSHERADRWLEQWLPRRLPLESLADRSNAGLASSFDVVVCTTSWAAAEFERLGVSTVVIPLGVDHDEFPARLAPREADGTARLVLASRLSKEKRPELAVEAVRELGRRRVRCRLVVAGDGPMRHALEERADGLPVEFRGFISDRGTLARLLAGSDVALAPGPVETFGLAALEALACGTPVVVNRHSALPEVVGTAGRVAPASGFTFADAVQSLLAEDEGKRRRAAHDRARTFDWDTTVDGFLGVHAGRRLRLAS